MPEDNQTAQGLSPEAKSKLSKWVEESWEELRQNSNRDLENTDPVLYKKTRDKYYRTASLATICDHEARMPIITRWNEVQGAYLGRVIGAIGQRQRKIASELSAGEKTIGELEEIKRKVDAEWTALRKPGAAPTSDKLVELADLQDKILPLENHRENATKMKLSLSTFEGAVKELNFISELSALDRIHYVIPCADEILDKLQKNEYLSIPIELFRVHPVAVSLPRYAQSSPTSEIIPARSGILGSGPTERPPELLALLEMKRVIDSYATGQRFLSGRVKKDLPAGCILTAGLIGSYLRSEPALFGISKEERHKFSKTGQRPIPEDEFIKKIISCLRPIERASVNKFYIKRALEIVRADIGYDEFTSERVGESVKELGISLDFISVGRNMSLSMEDFGIRQKRKDGLKWVYEFAEITVTDEYRVAIQKALPTFGYGSFSVNDLRNQIRTESGVHIHERALVYALNTEKERFGMQLVTVTPIPTYQKIERPPSAETQKKVAGTDMGKVF